MTELRTHLLDAAQATAKLTLGLLLAAVVVYAVSGVYSVEPGEIAVHTRFGAILDHAVQPGIHIGLPTPLDEVFKVPVKRMESVRVDDFADSQAQVQTQTQTAKAHSFSVLTGIPTYCLTGDNNIVTISCVGQYTIHGAARFLFATTDPKGLLQRVIANALLHCLAGKSVDSILTSGKMEIAEFVKAWVNRRLADFDCGLQIQFLELKHVDPPILVQAHFQDVIKAGIDRKKMISDAEGYQNQRISVANAEAERTMQEAMAYRTDMIARAVGESERFLKRLSEFNKNPRLVRQKEYFDVITTLGRRYPNKIILGRDRRGNMPVSLRLAWP